MEAVTSQWVLRCKFKIYYGREFKVLLWGAILKHIHLWYWITKDSGLASCDSRMIINEAKWEEGEKEKSMWKLRSNLSWFHTGSHALTHASGSPFRFTELFPPCKGPMFISRSESSFWKSITCSASCWVRLLQMNHQFKNFEIIYVTYWGPIVDETEMAPIRKEITLYVCSYDIQA